MMQKLNRDDSVLNEFLAIATKYQAFDSTYNDLSHSDGAFLNECVERAYIVFMYVRFAEDESNIKKAFNLWRSFYFGESRRIDVFFKFMEMLHGQNVNEIWLNKWDCQFRNINLEREYICRIFILYGITVQLQFYKSGVLQ